ncbi:hypothetical protein Dsin_007374 [Dipteronia sinensis]|uniref:F-box domain-containing protein n=1 Tax=Dipteronia sinensis TaxID=43782 RepID=A0AAE0EH14_9ROSI|nr:hypothetical protein Dsin_007374 [Dipteronia sinensis]
MALEKLGKKDIISRLSDDVLIHILSRLQTKDAVRTCVLSSRWRNLWTLIYNFYFDDGEDDPFGRCPNFEKFVSGVLSVCQSKDVHNFYLDCTMISDDEISHVIPWISFAVERKVRNLNLKVDMDRAGVWLVRLPQSILTCSSLVELTMLSDCIFDIPDSSVVCFPSLKIIFMSIRSPDGNLMKKLFRNCPILEDLSIHGSNLKNKDELTFDINVPTLKMFRIWLGMEYYVSKHKYVITARDLECLHIKDFTSSNFLVNDSPFLDVASLDVHEMPGAIDEMDELEVNRAMELLRGINCTKSLSLTAYTMEFLSLAIKDNMPTFPIMIDLELGIKASFGWKLLPHFLSSSPNLESLTLEMNHRVECALQGFLPFESKSVPSCLRLHLKVIEITDMRGICGELEVIKYLLKNSEVLEKLEVNFASSMKKKYLRRQILNYYRGSPTCEIKFI